MPDKPQFLAHIHENPRESGPRLVFADWLEEQGDPQAEMIRLLEEALQMRRAERSGQHLCEVWEYLPAGKCDHCDYCRVMTRAKALWEQGVRGIYD